MSRKNNNRNERNPRDQDPRIKFVNSLLNQNNDQCITNESSLSRFLEGVQHFDNPKDFLFSLVDPKKAGAQVLEDAFCLCDDANKINQFAVPFLELLGKEDLYKGTCKSCVEQCYQIIYQVPGFIDCLSKVLASNQITKPSVIAWFIKTLACENPEIREDAKVKQIADILSRDSSPAVRDLITVLFPARRKEEFETSTKSRKLTKVADPRSFNDLEAWEPQHDNDFPFDYRSIKILPSAAELNCKIPPSFGCNKLWTTGPEEKEEKVAVALDRQFRLLRSDMTIPMKSELIEEWKLPPGKRRRVFNEPRLLDICAEEKGGGAYLLIEVDMSPQLLGRLSKLSQKERVKFLEDAGKRILGRESVLLILSDTNTESLPVVASIGVVTHRDPKEMVSNYGTLRVGVSFEEGALRELVGLYKQIEEGSKSNHNKEPKYKKIVPYGNKIGMSLFQASSSYFSYKPVLERLQTMTHVPFAREFVHQQRSPKFRDHRSIPEEISEKLSSDSSQLAAVEYALNHRVTLIQGPPGTGKTFCGVQLAQAILAQDSSHRILCLCYTNHALDDFLLSLHEDGLALSEIVRIGRSPKIHESLKDRCLGDMSDHGFDRQQTRRFAMLKDEQTANYKNLKSIKNKLCRRADQWGVISEFLQSGSEAQYEAWRELKLPEGLETTTSLGMKVAGKKGKKSIQENYLWDKWCRGERRDSILVDFPRYKPCTGFTSVWDLDKNERTVLLSQWQSEAIQPVIDEAVSLMKERGDVDRNLSALRDEAKVPAAREASVIGCTTTGAAKNSELLAQIQPSVVIIEEAAEILEANVLTALGDSVQQCFMIGDHKQLRPKLETYDLRQESGKGVDFDVSLFERLANQSKFPVHTLKVQHRMRPEISALIRATTYPDLLDAESVRNRPDIRGLTSNLVFVSHNKYESSDEENAVLGVNSKINLHEVMMVTRIVLYLLQQGYGASEIVVLTPYLGQLVQIRNALKGKVGVSIGDMDRMELKKLDPDADVGQKDSRDGEGKSSVEPETVRVATVDNFQGEESRVVIGSLVRSNEDGDIGFVSGAERINVLLSRARDGLILLGNENTLRNAKSDRGRRLWNSVLDLFKAQNSIFEGFPARCENHGISPPTPLCFPDDFNKYTPNGGCCSPCGFVLPSCPFKHTCPFACHPSYLSSNQDQSKLTLKQRLALVHRNIPCKQEIEERCPATKGLELGKAHFVFRLCHEAAAKPCEVSVICQCPEGHSVNRKCGVPLKPAQCPVCCKIKHERQQQELEMKKRAQALQVAELDRIKQVKKLEEERLRLADKMSMDRIKAETELLRQEIARVEQQQQSSAVVLQAKEHSKDVEESLPNTLVSPEYIQTSKTPSIPPAPPAYVSMPQVSFPDTRCADTNPFSAGEKPAAFPVEKPSQTLKSTTEENRAIVSLDNSGKANKKTTQVVNSMLKTASLEDWVGLYKLVEANDSEHGWGGLLAKVLKVLTYLHLRGYEQELLSQVELLYQVIRSLQPSALKDTLICAASFVCFAVADCDERLEMTATSYGETFLSLSRNVKGIPECWKEQAKKALSQKKENAERASDSRSNPTAQATKSSALDDWNRVKSSFGRGKGSPSPAVDKLMKMIGLESVKRNVVNQYHRIVLAQEQQSPAASSYNTRFDGNPGTGKTTVARLYSQYLKEVGILPIPAIIKETTGSQLINIGVKGLKDMLEEVKAAEGGVIFVDEAYQLNPQNDQQGRQVLDFLLVHAEKMKGEYGDLVWIFAGYKKDMDKLFEHNPGLPSRFPNHFNFEDYSDEELLKIFHDILQRGGAQDNQPEKRDQKPSPKPKTKSNNNTLNMPGYGYSSSMYGYGYGSGYGRPEETDRWGNVWRWDASASTFVDDYNNVTGYGAKNLGTTRNPLVSRKDNSMWIFDDSRNLWYSLDDSSRTSSTYPGKPPPPKPVVKPIPFTISDDKWARVAIRRLGRLRGSVGFGNARAVRILFENSRSRQAARVTQARQSGAKPDIFQLERDDLLGPKADRNTLMRSEAYQKLQRMEGLREVKNSVDQLLDLVIQNADREDAEKPMLGVALNRIFLGNPGTGKTTVAKLYASILATVGLLSKGEVILKNSSDFVGSALGTSEAITRGILKQAEGNVLVIDEAYGLNPSNGGSGAASGGTQDPYKTAVIDTIVEQVQGVPGEDRAVVMLGYRREMEALMADANPGLSRRFQMEQAFEFSDYDDAALIRILQSVVKSDKLKIDLPTSIFAVQRLARARALPNFGNAGAVNNLLSNAKLNFQARNSKLPQSQRTDRLICEDFCSGGKLPVETNEEDIFKDLSDCDQILRKLKEYKNTINLAKQQGKDPKKLVEFNFLFVGSPGTGKTTIARKMGTLFHSLGLLPTDECVETTAADLITGFVGQAAKKTEEVMRRARGKVLFIDEAYQLNPQKGGSYMQEVVDAMVQAMTSEELVGQIVIILAGYERDIDDMLKVNQGLRSRFSEKLMFDDFSISKTCNVIKTALEKQFDLECTPAVEAVLPSIAQRLSAAPNFGNGRDCQTLSKRIFREMADRTAGDENATDELVPADLEKALSKFLEGKRELLPDPNASSVTLPNLPQMTASASAIQPPPPVFTTTHHMETVKETVEDPKEVNKGGSGVDPFLMEFQNYLDQRGLNSKEGVARISTLDINSPELQQLASELAEILGISISDATDKIREWQTNQEDIREKMEEQEKEMKQAKLQKRKALVPIWRCAVCGRADMPYIACYVSPFIVRYSEMEV